MIIPASARLLAAHRARETERPNALFRDPYARALLGDIDAPVARVLAGGDATEWLFAARTRVFDRLIAREAAAGADLVVNLAAGLDARPYRLDLPASLRWVDVDLPEILEYKAGILASAAPSCAVSHHAVDLANPDARRGAFRDLARGASRVLVVCEGLLVHLMAGDVRALAQDLAAPAPFAVWLADIVSPPVMDLLNEQSGTFVRESGAPYLFAPREGPAFVDRNGWRVLGVRSLVAVALKQERLPIALRMAAFLGEGDFAPSRPWAGAILLGKDALEMRVE